jgi:hypothetical protein
MKPAAAGIALIFVAWSQAAMAETWQCSLHPRGYEKDVVEIGFEVRGDTLLRSPDDLAGERMAFRITKNSHETLTGTAKKVPRGTVTVAISKTAQKGIMTGSQGAGWKDVWEGPCHKLP